MATFPTYASLMAAGFGSRPDATVQRTDMESGPPKQLKKQSRAMVTRTVRYRLKSKTDYSNFITWFRSTINGGADWFDWTDPYDGQTKQARIVGGDITPDPIINTLEQWAVSMKIETWED